MSEQTHFNSAASWVLWLALAVLLPASLIEFPHNGVGEILREYSNLGHVVFFAILAHLLLGLRPVQQLNFRQRVLSLLLSALVIGAMIELLQALGSREPSLIDVLRDIAGALLVIAFLMPERVLITRWKQRSIQVFVLMLVLHDALFPSLRLYDRQIAARQFPVLSNLEHATESLRWSSGSRVNNPVRDGQYALKVDFTTELYSAVSMNYLPPDWQAYKTLIFSVFNPADHAVKLHIKIHDRQHYQHDQAYRDRFNKRWRLKPGWNDLSVDLRDVEGAPETRTMDMNEIAMLQFFTHNLNQSRSLYFDAIQMSP